MPAQFRKKPIVVEAQQFVDSETGPVIADWCGGRYRADDRTPGDPDGTRIIIMIPTLEGVMIANVGDWIIKGVHGEFYPVRAGVFEQTYEAA